MKYIIERSVAGAGIDWVRSESFPCTYTNDEAQGILDDAPSMLYRITEMGKPAPYRRHAVVTFLELRGARAVIDSAQKHIVRAVRSDFEGRVYFDAFTILNDARLVVTRQLETL